MPRTPKSKKSSSCWTVLSFFSSGLSDGSTTTGTTTRTTATTTAPSTPTGTTAVAAAATAAATITTEKRQKQNKSGSKKESPTSDGKKADPSWIKLHDRDSDPFWLDKNTGHWTYDGITVYGPPASATPTGYPPLWAHPHQQPLPQPVPCAQPAMGYYAPAPYAAVHHGWQHAPPSAGTPVAAAVPGTIPAGTTGVPPVFF